jgi:hypothetical protein
MLLCAGAAHAATSEKHTSDPCASKPSKWQKMQCEDYNHSAPGDEYFGRMKMSYLGINNTFHDSTIRAGSYTTSPGIISQINFADEALEAWSHKYPHDPQLARTYFLAIQAYEKIYTLPAQQKAWSYMHILTERFPTSYFGKVTKKSLDRGFTEHYFADAQPCPAASANASAAPKASSAAALSTQPDPPGQPKVDVITPPCVP